MLGLMQNQPLLVSSLIEFAERHHGDTEIVSRRVEGDIHRTTYRALSARAKQLANALDSLGLQAGARVASLAWNGYRHLEMYFGVSGSQRVLHTVIALNYGAVLALWAPELLRWAEAPTGFVAVDYGAWSWLRSRHARRR